MSIIPEYARVSTSEQNPEAQLDALRRAGADRTYAEKISGLLRKRPELDRLFDQLRKDARGPAPPGRHCG